MFIAIDFDGTCVSNDFPKMGKDIGAVPVLKELVEKGHTLILNTVRSDEKEKKKSNVLKSEVKGNTLTEAVNWFKENDIELKYINRNPIQWTYSTSNKVDAALFIDDKSLGCPLIYDPEIDDYYMDWKIGRELLVEKGIL